MKQEKKTCQNCKKWFIIETDDFDFYKKIKVPAPTFCPECRLQRRLAFRNEWNLYRRKCDATGKQVISVYSPSKPFPVYSAKAWYSDTWDPIKYGKAYDFTKTFFEQFYELRSHVPRLALANIKSINSEYTNYAVGNKNCYLLVSAMDNENCFYSYRLLNSKDSLDCLEIHECELCYEGVQLDNCYKSFFCQLGESLYNCWFCYDCKGCTDCFGCTGLRNKSYYWFNQPLSKKEYEAKITQFQDSSHWMIKAQQQFDKILAGYPRRATRIIRSVNCTGDDIINSKNCKDCFHARSGEDGKYIIFATGIKDFMDISLDDDSEHTYEVMSGQGNYGVILSTQCWYSRDVQYSDLCQNCQNCFGCVGLRGKQYCILNRQYSKEEYKKLVPEIIQHMNETPYTDKKGRVYKYGEFFPIEFSPFGYNESAADDYFTLEKKEAVAQGYVWDEYKSAPLRTAPYTAPATIKQVEDDVLDKAIHSKISGKPFKIVKYELDFYKKFNLPLPLITPFERHRRRLQKLSPLKLYQRYCDKCNTIVTTPYAPEGKEIVYCEKCYQQEVV
ncbi:hypothetical protein MYX06_00015 [Patescibacteria group bacterium AH-259-L05]|nr:hypothetical protein [Patescibacteria group bacterium AH-259-L05]